MYSISYEALQRGGGGRKLGKFVYVIYARPQRHTGDEEIKSKQSMT